MFICSFVIHGVAVMVGGRIAPFQRDGSQDVNMDMSVNVYVTSVDAFHEAPALRSTRSQSRALALRKKGCKLFVLYIFMEYLLPISPVKLIVSQR